MLLTTVSSVDHRPRKQLNGNAYIEGQFSTCMSRNKVYDDETLSRSNTVSNMARYDIASQKGRTPKIPVATQQC